MKNHLLIALIITLSTVSATAQKKKKTETPPAVQSAPAAQVNAQVKKDTASVSPMLRHYATKYATAIQWNDYDVAKDALYDLIVENPGNDSIIFDLALFYYQNQKTASSVLVANELLARNSKNEAALEIAAVGLEALGAYEKSLQNYESLYLINTNIQVLYKMAYLQYRLKRYKESMTSVDILLAKKEAESAKISFNDSTGKPKEYSLKVAILTLKGMNMLDQADKAGAKKVFEQALAIAPDFALAKENLAKTK